jgi:hypothetical protein
VVNKAQRADAVTTPLIPATVRERDVVAANEEAGAELSDESNRDVRERARYDGFKFANLNPPSCLGARRLVCDDLSNTPYKLLGRHRL